MKILNNAGMILLSIWLIASGLVTVLRIQFRNSTVILSVLAVLAGILILFRIRDSKVTINLGMLSLSIWLILQGMIPLLHATFPASEFIMAAFALGAGILLLVGQ